MGFFYCGSRSQLAQQTSSSKKHIPIKLMNDVGCKACPLDKNEKDLDSPKMEPDGSSSPSIYILGEAPGETEDRGGIPFAGKSGNLLRNQFSQPFLDREVRIHNTIRCRPPDNRTPEMVEIECCRGFIESDIEKTKPLVIVGAGGVPLSWATSLPGGINKWRGKMIAVRIGSHECWYYPVFHPSYVLRSQKKHGKSEIETTFEYDLNWIINEVETGTIPPPPKIYTSGFDKGITCINGEEPNHFTLLEDLLNELLVEEYVGIDLETSGLRPYHKDSKIYTCAVGTFDKTVAFAMDHPQDGWSDSMRRRVRGLFADFLLQSGRKIAHHLAFEMEWIAYFYGNEILRLTEWEDTLAQAHTIDERTGTNKLDFLTRQYFGFFLKDKSPVDASKILSYSLDEVLPYNGMDTKWTHKLFFAQKLLIDNVPEYQVEYERKINLIPTLVLSQLKGVLVDFDYAEKMESVLNGEIKIIEDKINRCNEVIKYERRFGKFRPTAPEDVVKMLKDICQRDEIERQDGGYTSGEEALNKIPTDEVPSAALILEHRTTSKLLASYIEPIISRRIVYPDGRIHTKYNPMIAVTGRLASEEPNIQNFPKRKHKDIRGIIVPPDGYWLLPCDYGQIEARVVAMASEDQNLVKYLWTGYDIHDYWGRRIHNVDSSIEQFIIEDLKIDPEKDEKKFFKALRQEAKNKWVFPSFFGSHFRSCARDLHISNDAAEMLMDEFWDEFRGVKKWQDKLIKQYDKKLYVETLSGRRRRGVMTKNELINHPIQGTACDIVTKAMDALSELSLELDDDTLQPPLNVHDDLTFYIPDTQMEDKIEIITEEMCKHRFDFIIVPLIVEVSAGSRWHEIEEIGVYSSEKLFNIRNPYK